jgi:DNA-directed RNA polymerase subunit H (RpoH/RPB5)
MSDNKVVQVFRAMKVILEMLEFRGYNVEQYKNYTLETIRNKVEESGDDYLESPLNIYVNNPDKDKNCLVVFFLNKKFKKQYASDIMEYVLDEDSPTPIREESGDECVFISMYPVKESGLAAITSIHNEFKIPCQLFYIMNLMYNILNHKLVPEYRIISEDEIEEVKNKYHVQRLSQFPLIKSHDAVARFIGLHAGNVVEIKNKSKNGGVNIYYRYCDV